MSACSAGVSISCCIFASQSSGAFYDDSMAMPSQMSRRLTGRRRGAVSELAGSLLTLAAGYAALSKATPGALSAGTAAAMAIAQHLAIANFWLGSTVGAWYYAVFPVAASAGLVAATTGALLAAG